MSSERGKWVGFAVAALVLGAVGAGAAVVWLQDGGVTAGLLAGVFLPLAVVAGPVAGLRAHSRSRLQAVLDQFADRQLEREGRPVRRTARESGALKDSERSVQSGSR
jgi:hypothetical protein